MFGKKKHHTQIDKDQLELIEYAQSRIRQKKRFRTHVLLFFIGGLFLFLTNTILGVGNHFKLFNYNWHVIATFVWLFFLTYHAFNVLIGHSFMGKSWEKKQLEKLVAKQQIKINTLKKGLDKETEMMLQSQAEKAILTSEQSSNITIIVAASENNVIGKDNQLIWHLRDDLKRFKQLTNGHCIIMGRKTFESFPKPLPNRTHIVITRQTNYQVPDGVIVVHSLEDAIDASKHDSQPFVIGGGEIYKQAMSIAHTIELTKVHHQFEGDTFFPEVDALKWTEINQTFHDKDGNHEHAFSFISYTKNIV